MIKLRLTGTIEELEKMIQILKENVNITELSRPYRNSNSSYFRVYLTVE